MTLSPEAYIPNLITWATDYKHNLRGFFVNKIDINSLYEINQKTYKHMVSNIVKNQARSRDLGIIANYISSNGNL
jgi:hypothetical protein